MVVLIVGGVVLLVGLILIPTPVVSGVPAILAGLAILASEFPWAHRLLVRFREKIADAGRCVGSWRHGGKGGS